MYIYVCMYVYIYICIYICICTITLYTHVSLAFSEGCKPQNPQLTTSRSCFQNCWNLLYIKCADTHIFFMCIFKETHNFEIIVVACYSNYKRESCEFVFFSPVVVQPIISHGCIDKFWWMKPGWNRHKHDRLAEQCFGCSLGLGSFYFELQQ